MAVNGFVYVVESPGADDLIDGRTEGKALCEALRLAEIPVSYSLAATKAALTATLGDRIENEARAHHHRTGRQCLPILHLSMHGNADGVQLTDGTFLTWGNLSQAIRPLGDTMRGGLLLCMSSCEGGFAARMAMNDDETVPFWAVVGSSENVRWADAAVAFISFYHSFFLEQPIEECTRRMREASSNTTFFAWHGEKVAADWREFQAKHPPQSQEFSGLAAMLRDWKPPERGGALSQLFAPSQPDRR